jgi:hypothetical protein
VFVDTQENRKSFMARKMQKAPIKKVELPLQGKQLDCLPFSKKSFAVFLVSDQHNQKKARAKQVEERFGYNTSIQV